MSYVFSYLFAEGLSTESWLIIIGGVITAGTTGYIAVKQALAKLRADEQDQKISDREKIFDRQEKQLESSRAQINEQQEMIEKLHSAHSWCREESAELYGWARQFRDYAVNLTEEVRRLGGHPRDVPELPPRNPSILSREETDFMRRTSAQNTELINTLDSTKTPPPPTKK